MNTVTVDIPRPLELKIHLTDEQFWQLCRDNDDLQFERTATGELIIMPLTGGTTSKINADLVYQLQAWNRQYKLGEVFDSNGCFKLPNGAERAPDASWVKSERWNTLTTAQQDKFPPICPDFVVELMSPNDSLNKTRKKLEEYLENGAQLGWLINRKQRQIEIYRPQQQPEILTNPDTVSGEDILPEFTLDLSTIW
jgi:Uma2 family endonuclease